MSVTSRDRKILIVLMLAGLIAAYWFLALGPKLKQAGEAGARVASEQQRLASANSQLATLERARADYGSDYATVVRLGKAIPTSVDTASLMIQLQKAADGTDIRFSAIEAGDRQVGPTAPRSLQKAASEETGQQPASGQPRSDGVGQQAAAGADPAADVARAREDTPAAREAAEQAQSSPTLAAGGLEAIPLEFTFDGSFFDLAAFFHDMKRFVEVTNDQIRVGGRLMTIDNLTLESKPEEFPEVQAVVSATAYVSPKVGGVTGGARPEGPAPAASAAEQPAPPATTAPTPTASVAP